MLTRALDPEGRAHWLWTRPEGVRDLSLAGLGPEIAAAARWLAQDARARAALLEQAPVVPGAEDWTTMLPGTPGKILALGRNFAAHAEEMGAEPSLDDMLWFQKFPESCQAPGTDLRVPSWLEGRIDPEAELVLLLGADLQDADEADARAAIAGWTLGNDFTARGVQAGDKEKAWPWVRSKNLRGFGSYGPGWLPADALRDWDTLRLEGWVNDECRQAGMLNELLYRPARALAELSRWVPLRTGDLLFLGTPAGVAGLEHGDVTRVRLVDTDGQLPLGELRHRVVRE